MTEAGAAASHCTLSVNSAHEAERPHYGDDSSSGLWPFDCFTASWELSLGPQNSSLHL